MMENEETIKIDKCVYYVTVSDHSPKCTSSVINGRYMTPISLPKLKCLEEFGDKYHPYVEAEHKVKTFCKNLDDVAKEDGVTERDILAYKMYKDGKYIKDIGPALNLTKSQAQKSVFKVRVKLGEIPPPKPSDRFRDYRDKEPKGKLTLETMNEFQRQVYELHKLGLNNRMIGERLSKSRSCVSSAVRRIKHRLVESVKNG